MTCDVMVAVRGRAHRGRMKKILVPLAVLVPFTAFSIWLTLDTGYLGFIRLAGREPWALQMLLDVGIACTVCSIWMVRDARARGARVWPYLVATVFLGSIGVLAYLVHRDVVRHGAAAARAVGGAQQPWPSRV